MSFLTSFLRVITFGLWREKDNRNDYYDEQKETHWYWKKDILYVYVIGTNKPEIEHAIFQWAAVTDKIGITLSFYNTSGPDNCDILIEVGDAVKKGGVCVRVPQKHDPREIAWAKIVIAKGENGKRLESVAMHEIGHALGLTHDGARDRNVMSPSATVDSLDSQTINTLERIYEGRNNGREE
jgi:hypothetical protein